MNYKTKSYNLDDLTILTASSQNQLKIELLAKTRVCPLCENPIIKPVLDHQHMISKETIGQNGAGLVRGVICSSCNTMLGKIENNSRRFQIKNLILYLGNVSKYLQQDNLPYIHSTESKRLKETLKKSDYNKMVKDYSLKSGKDKIWILKKYPYNKYLTKNLKKFKLLVYGC